MANLLLTADGDLDLSSGNLQLVTGPDELVQKLTIRLRFFLGECFADLRQGMPYFEKVLVKNPDLVVIQAIFREAIVTTPGVDVLLGTIETTLDSTTRMLSVSFTVRSVAGDVVDFDKEFLISV